MTEYHQEQQVFDAVQKFFLSEGARRVEEAVRGLQGTIQIEGMDPALRVLGERLAIGIYLMVSTCETLIGKACAAQGRSVEECQETAMAFLYAALGGRESTRTPTPEWVLVALFNGLVVEQFLDSVEKMKGATKTDD